MWPSKTSGLYYDYNNASLIKANSPCGKLEYLTNVPGKVQDVSTTFTKTDSFVAFILSGSIIEYNIGLGNVSK